MMSKLSRIWLVMLLGVLGLTAPLQAQSASEESPSAADEAPVVEPQAMQLLRAMSDYLGSLKQFRLNVESSLDVVLDSGQKLQFDMAGSVLLRRPNGIYATRRSAVLDQEFFYDGQQLTVYGKIANTYSSVAAPPSINAALDFAQDQLNLTTPLVDFLYSNPYKVLSNEMESGFYVGPALVDGVRCHHLAFHGPDLDWQIWIEDSKIPLPHKYLITSSKLEELPQYTARMLDWNVDPQAKDQDFRFVAPAGAEKIDFLPAEAAQ